METFCRIYISLCTKAFRKRKPLLDPLGHSVNMYGVIVGSALVHLGNPDVREVRLMAVSIRTLANIHTYIKTFTFCLQSNASLEVQRARAAPYLRQQSPELVLAWRLSPGTGSATQRIVGRQWDRKRLGRTVRKGDTKNSTLFQCRQ